MNLKHDLETPISTLKTILALLKRDGVLPERFEKNATESFARIRQILIDWESLSVNSDRSLASNFKANVGASCAKGNSDKNFET